MIKLNKPVETLENILEKIEAKIEQLEGKRESMQENAWDNDRDMTEAEWDRFWKWGEQVEELQAEAEDIQSALDRLREYTE